LEGYKYTGYESNTIPSPNNINSFKSLPYANRLGWDKLKNRIVNLENQIWQMNEEQKTVEQDNKYLLELETEKNKLIQMKKIAQETLQKLGNDK
jgi:hypothetical protein